MLGSRCIPGLAGLKDKEANIRLIRTTRTATLSWLGQDRVADKAYQHKLELNINITAIKCTPSLSNYLSN